MVVSRCVPTHREIPEPNDSRAGADPGLPVENVGRRQPRTSAMSLLLLREEQCNDHAHRGWTCGILAHNIVVVLHAESDRLLAEHVNF